MLRQVCPSTSASAASSLVSQRRTYVGFKFSSIHAWKLPYGANSTKVTKEELNATKYNTKSREQWNYNRVDDTVNAFSEFRKVDHRPDFSGLREHTLLNDTHTPQEYRLMDHFDEYTKPGSDRKYQAACAVKEQWDADESYYPGEQWQRNRPGFRSVPKEILNRQSWYHWRTMFKNFDEIQATIRTRSWNPNWPPPGMKLPTFNTKKEFAYGADDPALMAEADRFAWFLSNVEYNFRVGFYEYILTFFAALLVWVETRYRFRQVQMRSQTNGMWYPGRVLVSPYGSITNLDEVYWWQRPLTEFKNQGEVWFHNQVRYGYANHLKKRDEMEAVAGLASH